MPEGVDSTAGLPGNLGLVPILSRYLRDGRVLSTR
jgi:hypothetical protein